ncbi:MAG: ATP-binding cassette domain-containing protein [Clostridia bacterium]|nr:ATP-binding cassette domain-containing protein [Clostridia bacterium]
MIEIQDLKKIYGERTVLSIPSLRFENGSSMVLAGANGSGKTTLIKILAGTLKATDGNLTLPQKIRYLPQQSYAFRGNLIKNITLAGADENTALHLLETMELAHLKEKKASSLSGGRTATPGAVPRARSKMRFAFAR